LQPGSGPDHGSSVCYTAPISFRFPKDAKSCCQAGKPRCPLPPSVAIEANGLRVRTTYAITARANKTGLLSRVMKTKRTLAFWPGDISQDQVHDSVQRDGFVHSSAMLPANKLQGRQESFLLPGLLPLYSPAVTLEMVLPSPPVLTPGGRMALQILIHAPRELMEDAGNLQMQTITTRLRQETVARIGSSTRSSATNWSLWTMRGAVPIDRELLEVDCGSWHGLLIPDVTPSFRSCFISQSYSLEVVAGILSRKQPHPQVRRNSFEVVIFVRLLCLHTDCSVCVCLH
jgi:hypothetical protein